MKRTVVFGDIHGGLKALKQLLTKIEVTPTDQLIFLGDYVDGWSESAQTIDFLIELKQANECTFILGNHDAWCRDWLKTGETNKIWIKHGGQQTIESYANYSIQQKKEHNAFFQEMENYYVDEMNNLFIHAGFTSMNGPSKEHYSSNYSWDRTLWETAVAMHTKLKKDSTSYPKRLLLFNEIFIGHTPTLHLGESNVMHKANVWNIDTGAAFTGTLSCMDINTKETWQSDPLPNLYPDEKGRN